MATRRLGLFCFLMLRALAPIEVANAATANGPISPPAIGLFYSFESAPSNDTIASMKQELERILAPSGVRLAWRPLDSNRGNETFPEVLVMRFRGSCEMNLAMNFGELGPDSAVNELAETQRSDGKMMPFGEVQCDQLRRYLQPSVESERPAARNPVLGRAMARVVAHEMYHMLTGAMVHAKQGIFRASHSREDLTAKTFNFATLEMTRLREWNDRTVRGMGILAGGTASQTDALAESDRQQL